MCEENGLLIYDLASRSDNRLEAEHCVLKSIKESRVSTEMAEFFVSLTGHGEIIVCCHLLYDTILTKISTDLTRQWSVTVDWDVVAVGTHHVYGLVLIDDVDDRNMKARLVTRRLNNEAEISDILIAGSFPRAAIQGRYVQLEATMTSNEHFLIFKNHIRIFGIIDILSGRMVPITGAEVPKLVMSNHVFLHPGSPDFRISVLETATKQFKTYDYVYDEKSATYDVSLISTVEYSKGRYTAGVVLASDLPDHLLVMRKGQTEFKKHRREFAIKSSSTRKGYCNMTIPLNKDSWEFVFDDLSTRKEYRNVTIPLGKLSREFVIMNSSTRKGYCNITIPFDKARTDLLIPRLDDFGDWDSLFWRRDYFRMIDGYLVYHDAEHRRLLVADFWPSW